MALLRIQDLSVTFATPHGSRKVVDRVSFHIKPGECLALVGESGSGKSVTAQSILKLLPYPLASHPSGSILFEDEELLSLSEKELQPIRGKRIGYVVQEPLTALNPLHTIYQQVSEPLRIHGTSSQALIQDQVKSLFVKVGLEGLLNRLEAYPHELSGGQRQRVMLAMALVCGPQLLIADEPTTALDVTTQAQILDLLQELQQDLKIAILLISHDLRVVQRVAQRVCVMHEGHIVESGSTSQVFSNPQKSYTKTLIQAEPKGPPVLVEGQAETILEVNQLSVCYPVREGLLRRSQRGVVGLKDLSFTLRQGETLGVLGESGSGKTTLAMALLRLQKSQGTIVFRGHRLDQLEGKGLRWLRRHLQIVFQDPFGSLNPRMTIEQIITEGLSVHEPHLTKRQVMARLEEVLQDVSLSLDFLDRYPHEFSGGQRQRIALARALILNPALLILDEPTSALDRTVQQDIVKVLKDLQEKRKVSYLFISHDLVVLKALSHQLIVLQKGQVMEQGDANHIFTNPQHSYTKALLKAAFERTLIP
jgi:microcin C transport system ATP-binding protein